MVFINQIRQKIGVMFGNPETTAGGNALKFYASVRLDIRSIGKIKEAAEGAKDPVVVGNRTRVKVVKNKMAPPFREVEFDILYGHGISHAGDVIDLATEANIVEKSGAWFSYQGERVGQGRENARTYLESHPAVLEKVEAAVLAKYGISRGGKGAEAPAAAAPPAKASKEGKDGAAAAPAQPAEGKRATPPKAN